MTNIECPYCQNKNMPTPKREPRPFGKCPNCGKKSRAAISYDFSGKMYVHYSATNLRTLGPDDIKSVYSIRLSKRDLRDIEIGRKCVSVCNGRLLLQYKS